MLEDELAEAAQVHGRQGRVLRPDEVLVEPLRLFDLEADSLDRGELFVGEVYDEADAEVVEPFPLLVSIPGMHSVKVRRGGGNVQSTSCIFISAIVSCCAAHTLL